MSPDEKRAGRGLALIFALRMLGLFLILPVFAVHAGGLPGGDNLALVGAVLGAYGLTQALFQIPFGMASDRFGRKRIIALGLLLFAVGSFLAAASDNLWLMLAGRALQGAGAISAAVTALAADLTREEHRTKIMAMIGASIGVVFALSLAAAPKLYDWLGMAGLFAATGVLALLAVVLLYRRVPNPPPVAAHAARGQLRDVLRQPELLRLNAGAFILHAIQMALFVVVPARLVSEAGLALGDHWQVYLPVVLVSFAAMVPVIIRAERRGRLKPAFVAAVGLVGLSQLLLALLPAGLWTLALALLVFFVGFNILEASLPSLISRIAPAVAKGAALGVHNTLQALGVFAGGALGGVAAGQFGAEAVFVAGIVLSLLWLLLALAMRPPVVLVRREWPLPAGAEPEAWRQRLLKLPGVCEASVHPERGVAYLRVSLEAWDETRARQLMGGGA